LLFQAKNRESRNNHIKNQLPILILKEIQKTKKQIMPEKLLLKKNQKQYKTKIAKKLLANINMITRRMIYDNFIGWIIYERGLFSKLDCLPVKPLMELLLNIYKTCFNLVTTPII
jgi:hypothetical protein